MFEIVFLISNVVLAFMEYRFSDSYTGPPTGISRGVFRILKMNTGCIKDEYSVSDKL
jgi:hypothetical protein